MKTYEIKVEKIEEYFCVVEAENKEDAISQAFSGVYSWQFNRGDRNPIKVYVREQGL